MIKTTRVTRKLTGMGVTSIVSLAGLLLPLAPTFAQQDPATATPAQEGKSYRVVEVVAGEASGGRGDTVKADERAVIQQLRAQSEALQAQAQIVAQQAQVAARQAQDTAQKAVGDAFNGFAQGGGKPNNPDPRQQMDREIQQARAEVQKLSAALGQATARLKMLEMQTAKMSANGMPNPGGFGGSMSGSGTPTPGGFGGSMSAGGMPSAGGFGGSMSGSGMKGAYPPAPKGGTSSADTVYGHVNVNMTPPSVTFTPGSGGFGGGGMTSIAVPSGTTMVRITPDGKIVETYNGPMNMPSSVEQRLSNLDAQLQMLRDEVQHIRKELHSGQSNGPRSDKGNYPDLKPSVSAAK